MNRQIVEYILQNRDRYTREAIRRSLIDAGHDPAEVDGAWESVESGRVPPPGLIAGGSDDPPPGRGPTSTATFWLVFLAYVLGLNALAFLLVGNNESLNELTGGDARTLLLMALSIGALLSIGLVAVSRVARVGAASGILVAALIPFTFVFIIAGFCASLGG